MDCELGFLGAGHMAEGIIAAALRGQVVRASEIIISDPIEDRRRLLVERFAVTETADNRQVLQRARRVILAVKPQSFAELASGLAGVVHGEQLLISILAGMSTARIQAVWPNAKARIVRVMPNLPIQVGAGMAGVVAGPGARAEDIAWVRRLFDCGGESILLSDESLMDALTALSGSGPAYFYYFVEAMVEGGQACGLSSAEALKLATHACLGAARMMIETAQDPAELRRKVTSKGGTTQAALESMTASGVDRAIREAIMAACRRGRELGA